MSYGGGGGPGALSQDLQLAGWTLETSSTTGKPYYWNGRTRQRFWYLRDGWGWAAAPDPKHGGRRVRKQYCHVLTGKRLPHPPGAAPPAAAGAKAAEAGPAAKKLRSARGGAAAAAAAAAAKKVAHAAAAQATAAAAAAAAQAKTAAAQAKTAAATDVEDDQLDDDFDDDHAGGGGAVAKRPSWKDVDLTPVNITDPALLAAVDWQAKPGMWRRQKNSPHVMQAFTNNTVYRSLSNLPFTRVMAPDGPTERYYRRKGEEKTVVSWADRSLLLMELEFLIRFDKVTTENLVVVFAGLGNSTCHVARLIEWLKYFRKLHIFPDVGEEYPRARALIEKRDDARVVWHDKPFDPTPELLQGEDFYGSFVVLISNPKTDMETDKAELMARQLRWYQTLQPKAALLKFDLPWPKKDDPPDASIEFPRGEIRFPIFSTPTGTEGRVVVAGSKFSFNDPDRGFAAERAATQSYDLRKCEGQFFHHNTCRRVSVYDHPVSGEGLDHCYDCTCEANILLEFARRRFAGKTEARHLEMAQKLTQKLSRDLADPHRPRTLNGFVGGGAGGAAKRKAGQ